ncbi:DUF6504 family protein, partial [Candidatus Hydrogenedentota bacterium]
LECKILLQELKLMRFIGEDIEALFDQSPALMKKPGCPNGFVWREGTYIIVEKLSEWHDYERRGRMAKNMRPEHAAMAAKRGSWGVGRDYYRVRTDSDRVFELYYDRSPKDSGDHAGGWFLYKELEGDLRNGTK